MITLRSQMVYMVARLQDGPTNLTSWYSRPFCVPFLQWVMAGLCHQHRTAVVSCVTPKAVMKDTAVSTLVSLLDYLPWGKSAATSGGALKQAYGETPVERNWDLPPKAGTNLLEVKFTHVSYLAVRGGQPQFSFQITTAPVDMLTAASWETPSQSHPAKRIPSSWPTETVWENKCLF